MTYRTPTSNPAFVPQLRRDTPATPELFGLLFAEVIGPSGSVTTPDLPGWDVRVWPVARLGDATLEARPQYPHLCAADLQLELERLGWSVLGPIRVKGATAPRNLQ